jgi:hypothetical protein
MREIRQLCAAALLTLALAFSAFAGDIQVPSVVEPPDPLNVESTPCVSGQMETSLISDTDLLADSTLAFMVNMLSVF